MLQQDYIMRLIREFMAALQRFLEKAEAEDRDTRLRQLYKDYLGEYELYHTETFDRIMQSFGQWDEGQRLYRMEMLADLYYVEADFRSEPTRTQMLDHALNLFRFIDRHSGTYSFDRLHKIDDITKKLQS